MNKNSIKTAEVILITTMFILAFSIKGDMSFFDRFIIGSVLAITAKTIFEFLFGESSSNSNTFSSIGWGNNVSNNQQTISSKRRKEKDDNSILFEDNKQSKGSTKPKNTINVNGKKYEVEGSNISVVNGKIYADGKLVNEEEVKANTIEIQGNINSLETDLSVNCNNVKGDIKAGGSINCDNVGGNITAGGSVNCDKVKGNINAKGSVNSM